MVSPSKSKVCFFSDEVTFNLKKRTALKKFIESIFRKERVGLGSVNYIFCSDKKLLDINRQYLNHDYYTDIITFDLSEKPTQIEGEIYISIDRVKDNAQNVDATLNSELHRVIFHGALHLCGYKDKTRTEKAIMTKMENHYLSLYFQK